MPAAKRKPAKRPAAKPAATRRAAPQKTAVRITSARQLGEALGVSGEAVRKWPAKPGWTLGPLPSPAKPWDARKLAAARAFRATLGEDRAAANVAVRASADNEEHAKTARQAKLHKELQQARKLKLENDRLEGKLVDRGDVERQNVQKVLAVRAGLLGLIDEFEARLPDDVAEDLDARVRQILEAFAGDRPMPEGYRPQDWPTE